MLHLLTTVAQYSTDPMSSDYSMPMTTTTTSTGPFPWALFLTVWTVLLVIFVILLTSLWKIYKKAGRPGWAAIVPIYNIWTLFEIVGYPGWWALLMFVPLANIFPTVMGCVAYFKLAKAFGKSDGFAVCTVLFSVVCLPILGFGSARFQGPANPNTPSGPQFGGYPQGPMPGQSGPTGMPQAPMSTSGQPMVEQQQPVNPQPMNQQPVAQQQQPANAPNQNTPPTIQ